MMEIAPILSGPNKTRQFHWYRFNQGCQNVYKNISIIILYLWRVKNYFDTQVTRLHEHNLLLSQSYEYQCVCIHYIPYVIKRTISHTFGVRMTQMKVSKGKRETMYDGSRSRMMYKIRDASHHQNVQVKDTIHSSVGGILLCGLCAMVLYVVWNRWQHRISTSEHVL